MPRRLDLVQRYLDYCRLVGKADSTIETWGYILDLAQRELPFGLDGADDGELLAWLARRRTPATRASYQATLVGFYRWACDPDDQWLKPNPAERLPTVRVDRGTPDPCTDDELALILACATNPVWLWSRLAAYLGARAIGISRMDREHIGPERTILHEKGGKRRAVPTHPLVRGLVEQLPPGPVARKRDGTRASPGYVSEIARYQYHRLGLPGMHLHRLRHWYLTQVQRIGGDIRITQDLAGHASPNTTAGYTAVADEQRRQVVDAIPSLVGSPGGSAVAAAEPTTRTAYPGTPDAAGAPAGDGPPR